MLCTAYSVLKEDKMEIVYLINHYTLVFALCDKNKVVGYELNESYLKKAMERLNE